MKITVRITSGSTYLDLNVDEVDLSKVPAIVTGQPTATEVMTAVSAQLFNGVVFAPPA